LKRPPPLPVRDGLGPARLRLQGGSVLGEFARRFGTEGVAKVLAGEVVDADGRVVDSSMEMAPGSVVFLYRELPDEVEVPFDIPIIYRDDNIVVVDKPHFLATIPRGKHVAQTVLVRLRRELGMAELSPAHRLDRLTAGVLLLTTHRQVRGRYQTLFAAGLTAKSYLARSGGVSNVALPHIVSNRIVKRRGSLQAIVEPGEPNAETSIQEIGDGLYRLLPRTGRTHQLRLHMASIGVPIANDPLYPRVVPAEPADFAAPLALLAHSLEFVDPISGERVRFESSRRI